MFLFSPGVTPGISPARPSPSARASASPKNNRGLIFNWIFAFSAFARRFRFFETFAVTLRDYGSITVAFTCSASHNVAILKTPHRPPPRAHTEPTESETPPRRDARRIGHIQHIHGCKYTRPTETTHACTHRGGGAAWSSSIDPLVQSNGLVMRRHDGVV
jgi:hypothetical protein